MNLGNNQSVSLIVPTEHQLTTSRLSVIEEQNSKKRQEFFITVMKTFENIFDWLLVHLFVVWWCY